MKVISGQWGGQAIPGKSTEKLRPTSDKLKESVFSILEAHWIEDWNEFRVLDLFAGLGSFGIESLSRGAKKATFIDSHLITTRRLQETLQTFGVPAERGEVICRGALDGISWLHQRGAKFDLIFMDPPYREDWVVAVLNRLKIKPILSPKGVVVAEHDKRESLSATEGFWKLEEARRFGDSAVTIFSRTKK